ncbi:MAG TPA: hypothetical protein VGB75_06730 [Jatrophihabitans sp.]|jgi:hypothetical protein|uniref:hypothetical protein n=1 Tax=Jatrophihabitans sp. TaxID=1932789 RepID=UPI002EF79711
MGKISRLAMGCSLIVGLLTSPPVSAASQTSASQTAASQTSAPIASAAPVSPLAGSGTAGAYHQVAATRVLDTRSGLGGYRGLVSPGRTVTFKAGSTNSWQAAVLDVTVPTPAPAGSLSVYPSGTSWDGRVTMTLTGGGNIQQQLTVRLGSDGGVTIRSNARYPTHILVDVLGYYWAGTATLEGMFAPANGRVLDTRNGIGAPRAAVGAGKKVTVALPGRGGIPAGGAIAVIANVAVLAPRSTGQLVVTDGDGSLATPRLRFVGHQTTPQTMQTQRIVNLGSDGALTFTNSSASSVQLVVDVFGYFVRDSAEGASGDGLGSYVPLSPQPVTALVLHGRAPGGLYLPAGDRALAINLVVTTDRPGQSVALGIHAPHHPWTGSPVVSSSAWLQPTELTVDASAGSVLIRSLIDTDVALHCYITGLYWLPHGV